MSETLQGIAFVSKLRTATESSRDISNPGGLENLTIFIDVTVDAESAAITPSVLAWDRASKKYFTLWTAAATVAAVAQTVYGLGPGLLVSVKEDYTDAGNIIIPPTFIIRMTAADGDDMTYSVGWALS